MRRIVLDTPSGEALSCSLAESFTERLVGLMGRAAPPSGGLLITPCRSVHTAFMRFRCDIVFLAADDRVLRVAKNTPPWRIRLAPPRTRRVLELAAGDATRLGLAPGTALTSGERPPGPA